MAPTNDLHNREILVGVTGGIAAYKTAMLVSHLVQSGASVSVIMTESATHLIGPRTFEALTNRPVRFSIWEDGQSHPHIESAHTAQLFCIAPVTANFLAKAALGLADDLLSTTYLAFNGPVIMAPAMNTAMWEKPAVQRNFQRLIDDGVTMIGPQAGYLSCGQNGVGRMSEPDVIYTAIVEAFDRMNR